MTIKLGAKERPGFSLVELLCWLAVVVLCLGMAVPTLRFFDDRSLLSSEADRLRLWLEGELVRSDRSSRSRTVFLVSPQLLKAQYSDDPHETEEFRSGEGYEILLDRYTGQSLPSVVYRPVVHTVTPAFTLTVQQVKEKTKQIKMIVSGRGALHVETVSGAGL